jgi:hypothetical protein
MALGTSATQMTAVSNKDLDNEDSESGARYSTSGSFNGAEVKN